MPDPTPEPEGLREKLDALVRLAIAHNAEDYCVRDARAAVWAEVQRLLNELEARLVDGAFTQAVANTREMRARELEGEKVDAETMGLRLDSSGMTPAETFEWMRRRIYDELEPALAARDQRIAELEADRARLDWLEREGYPAFERWSTGWGLDEHEWPTLRAAIDAARFHVPGPA
jgi:hypothetical protein